jgi:predicted RNase H-like nuclease
VASRVIGIDGCADGWVGIVLASDKTVNGFFAATISELVSTAESVGDLAVVAVDMPIGLADRSHRQADLQARKQVGPRHSSVFLAPIRGALDGADHATASELNRQASGFGLSAQAYGLIEKIKEVDAWVRSKPGPYRIVEVHPEVSFKILAGRPLPHAKRTWAGAEDRRGLLGAAGITLPTDLGTAGAAAHVDDVLDAAAAAWTARRVADGVAGCWPDPPEVFSDRMRCAIWA